MCSIGVNADRCHGKSCLLPNLGRLCCMGLTELITDLTCPRPRNRRLGFRSGKEAVYYVPDAGATVCRASLIG